LSNLGRHDEALTEIRRAREMDPPNPLFNAMEGQILCFAGKEAESTQKLKAAIEIDPDFWLAHLFISRNYALEQNWPEAIASATKAKNITNGNTEATATIGYVLARAGRRDEALAVLRELEAKATSQYVPQYAIAQIFLALGDKEKALDALDRGYDQRDALMVFVNVEPKLAELRSEPRFIDLLKRMNLDR
jgi:serine/threonine-protein kinase